LFAENFREKFPDKIRFTARSTEQEHSLQLNPVRLAQNAFVAFSFKRVTAQNRSIPSSESGKNIQNLPSPPYR
jgi:hypothetical protein